MDDEREQQGLSRRDVIKRAAVVGAVAWTAPVISSIRTPAFAASRAPCPGTDWQCGDPIVSCGTGCGTLNQCICDVDVAGNTFCWDDFSCDPACGASSCSSNADCDGIGSGGWRCVTSCCGQTCAPPCGECDLCGFTKGGRRGSA